MKYDLKGHSRSEKTTFLFLKSTYSFVLFVLLIDCSQNADEQYKDDIGLVYYSVLYI